MKKSLFIVTLLLSLSLTSCIFDKSNSTANDAKDATTSETSESSKSEKPSTVEINPPSYF